MKNKGWCWCVHHKELLEYCYDFVGRQEIIKEVKPKNEIPTRLYEMRLVKGKLPAEFLKAYAAWKRVDAVWKIVDATCKKYIETMHKKEVPGTCWNGKKLDFKNKIPRKEL